MHRINRLFAIAVIAAITVSSFTFPASAMAKEDMANAGKDMAGQANKAAQGMIDTFMGAVRGEEGKMQELLQVYLAPALIALVALFIGYMVASFIGRIVGGLVTRKIDVTLGKFMAKMVRNLIMIMVLLGTLSTFGVDVTSFAAILAAAGFAVGMALQGTLASFAAGVMLLVFRPFKVDDYIVAAGTEGTVEEIDLFSTRLNSLDNRHLIIPNSEIFGSMIENYSRNEVRRVDVNVGTEYSADLGATRIALENAIGQVAGQIASSAPQVYLVELGDSAVSWQCRVWCRPSDYWGVRENLTEAVKNSLDRSNIGIPFPQVDVNIVGQLVAKNRAA